MCDFNTMERVNLAELVKELRGVSSGKVDSRYLFYTLCNRAADAIEELQADKAALNGTVTNLLEQIKNLGKPHWIPVTERLPEVGEIVLTVWSVKGRDPVFTVAEFRGVEHGVHVTAGPWEEPIFVERYGHQITPTHWMPLPSTEGLNET